MYKVGKRPKSKKKRALFWMVIVLILALLIVVGVILVRRALRPKTVIKQSTAVVSKVTYNTQTKTYNEPDFSIALPSDWTYVPPAVGPYQSYTWQSSASDTDGQLIQVFENTIPANFAVNRELVVEGEVDHLTLNGVASDNCSTFTKNTAATASSIGVPAKWQGVSFLCDQGNTERDVIGTSSTDGVNTVILHTSNGQNHKFLFSYTDHSQNPDYSIFYNALESLRTN